MGVYSDGKVYGIKLSDSNFITFYEKTNFQELNEVELSEARGLWLSLSEDVRNKTEITFYTQCCSTLSITENRTLFMSWFPGSRGQLERLLLL